MLQAMDARPSTSRKEASMIFIAVLCAIGLAESGYADDHQATDLPVIHLQDGENRIALTVAVDEGGQPGPIEGRVPLSALPAGLRVLESPDRIAGEEDPDVLILLHVGATTPDSFELPVELWGRDTGFLGSFTVLARRCSSVSPSSRLLETAPNPFNPTIQISFAIAGVEALQTVLTLYNTQGQPVRTLLDARKAPGRYQVVWDGRDDNGRTVGAGVYLCRIGVGDVVDTRKITLVR
jgi:flagellar hook capping protein FlgD